MSAIYIQNLLTLRRKAAGKILSPSRARAESKLLFNQALKILSTTIEKTADDDFPQRYHGILNLPGNEAPFSSQIDLFERLVVFKGHSLMLTQPGKNDDSVWTLGQKTADGTRNYFWFPPVDASSLMVPPHKRHYRRTRADVAHWGNVAVMVPDSNVPALVRLLKKGKSSVKAIIAAENGVCVIFRTDAQDYPSWQQWCSVLEKHLGDAGVYVNKISLGTLVPTSNESRGIGSLLYLA